MRRLLPVAVVLAALALYAMSDAQSAEVPLEHRRLEITSFGVEPGADDGTVEATLVVHNSGQHALRGVRVDMRAKHAKAQRRMPESTARLAPGASRKFRIVVRLENGATLDDGPSTWIAEDSESWARVALVRRPEEDVTLAHALNIEVKGLAAARTNRDQAFTFRVARLPSPGIDWGYTPASEVLLSLALPPGVRVTSGRAFLRAKLAEKPTQLSPPHAMPPVTLRADRPGAYPIRVVVRSENGLAATAAEFNLLVSGTGPGDSLHVPAADLLPEDEVGGLETVGGAYGGRARRYARMTQGVDLDRRNAIEAGLAWLAAHQSPNGRWEAAGFDKWCKFAPQVDRKRPDGLGHPAYDVGVTGLALSAFLGAGYTHRGKHPYRRNLSMGLVYLKRVQDPEGCFGSRRASSFIYNHAMAALAMVEAYGLTGSPSLRIPAQQAVAFNRLARNPYYAWRYGVKPGDNDTSVTGWMYTVHHSAEVANRYAGVHDGLLPLELDPGAEKGAKSWLDKMVDADFGRYGYITRGSGSARPKEVVDRWPAELSESTTAIGVFLRRLMGVDPREDPILQRSANLLLKMLPTWNEADGSIDMYYWYYGAQAAHQLGGAAARNWRTALARSVVETQRRDTSPCEYKGSWNPLGPWGEDGGRVYSTAILTMALQADLRYERVPPK